MTEKSANLLVVFLMTSISETHPKAERKHDNQQLFPEFKRTSETLLCCSFLVLFCLRSGPVRSGRGRELLTVSGQLMQRILVCSRHRCMRKKMRKATRNQSATTSKNWKAAQLGQPWASRMHRKAMSRESWKDKTPEP